MTLRRTVNAKSNKRQAHYWLRSEEPLEKRVKSRIGVALTVRRFLTESEAP